MNNLAGPVDMTEVMEILGDDKELLIECFDEFLSSMPQTLAEIQSAIEQKNTSDLDEAAHKLKGSLKYMAAHHAADVAYELEIMGKGKSLGTAYDTFRNLYEECEKVKDFMEQYKAGI